MMDIDKLINYLERKSADTTELQAASAIIQLRSELQEAKEVITVQHMALEDYGVTHDQRAQEIERLREQRDELLAALDCIAWTRHPACKLTAKHAEEYESIAARAIANTKETK